MKYFYILLISIFSCCFQTLEAQTDGDADTSFNGGTGFNDLVTTIALQTDGKILVGGAFTTYQGISANRIIRLNSNGSIDATFNYSTGFDSYVSDIIVQPDSKIIIVGYFSTYKGVSTNRIIRLNANGSVDNTFSFAGSSTALFVKNIEIQNDDKLLISRVFTTSGGLVINSDIVRLNTNGSIDTTFSTGTGFESTINSFKIATNGKIYVVGNFLTYKGVTLNTKRIIRLNSDGTSDSTFSDSTDKGYNDVVSCIALQTDEKIITGGNFSQYGNITSPRNISRLDTNGKSDSSFGKDGFPFNSGVSVGAVAIQNDGKIIIGGSFSEYKDIINVNIARLNNDSSGSVDMSFDTYNGFNDFVKVIKIQSDGKILVAGSFTKYNGVTRNRIIRLKGTPTLSTQEFEKNQYPIYPNPTKEFINLSNNLKGNFEIYDLLGKLLLKGKDIENKINISSLTNGIYLLKIESEGKIISQKFIKE